MANKNNFKDLMINDLLVNSPYWGMDVIEYYFHSCKYCNIPHDLEFKVRINKFVTIRSTRYMKLIDISKYHDDGMIATFHYVFNPNLSIPTLIGNIEIHSN